MKKAVGGCLAVLLVGVLLSAAGLWWFVVRPAWNVGNEVMVAAQQWAELGRIDASIVNRAAFAPPQDGVIAPDVVQRFVQVQQTIDSRLGDRLRQLDSKYRELKGDAAAASHEAGLKDLVGAYGDVFELIKLTRQTQVDALNAGGFSLEEYRWVRNQAYLSLGLGATAFASGDAVAPAASSNAAALAPHRDLLLRTAATAWLDF